MSASNQAGLCFMASPTFPEGPCELQSKLLKGDYTGDGRGLFSGLLKGIVGV